MIAASTGDITVIVIVVGARLLVPLLIIRFPLPAIVASLVIDAADQSIFQQMTDIDLTNYQGYDKALDIYYLSIAYISTFRNWRHPTALIVAMFLWYYRLFGVVFFELTEWRTLLLIFPNTFEYFFIFFEIVRVKWNTGRLSSSTIIKAAAAIWVFIKLPQEWWIHIAQLDFTDFVKEDLMGVDGTDSWGTALSNRPGVTLLIAGVLIGATVFVVRWWRGLPPGDHPFTFDADKVWPPRTVREAPARWTAGLLEKIVLLTLVLIIFAEGIPRLSASIPQILGAVAVVTAANAAVTHSLLRTRFRRAWQTPLAAFVATVAVNAVIWGVLQAITPSDDDGASGLATAFFLLLASLIITLFDRYRPRRPKIGLHEDFPGPEAAPAQVPARAS